MEISVVIPVFNAQAFVETAVRSALIQPQTAEVILIDDGSSDGSLDACRRLERLEDRVHVMRHPHGANLGASEARNLGVRSACSPFIAFLDVDDFYLPSRFSEAERVFREFPETDGVYEAIGTHFEDSKVEERWRASGFPLFTSIQSGVPPENLFESQAPIGKRGYCSLDGLTVRKGVFGKVGFFDPLLRLHQDTAFFMKLAAAACLRAGNVMTPVTMRRVHEDNRISREKTDQEIWANRRKMWLSVVRWLLRAKPKQYRERSALVISKLLWQLHCRPDGASHRLLGRYIDIVRDYPWLVTYPPFMKAVAKRNLGGKR